VKILTHEFLSDQRDSAYVSMNLVFRSNSIANSQGDRIVVNTSLIKLTAIDDIDSDRSLTYFYNEPFSQTDTVYISVPKDYKLESNEWTEKFIESEFGKFSVKVVHDLKNDQLVMTRYFSVDEAEIGPLKLQLWNKFLSSVENAKNVPVVLVKK